jgi:hypothetical protein
VVPQSGDAREPGKLLLFSADNERLIGAVYYIRAIDHFAYVLLARDKLERYQAFSNIGPFPTARAAEQAIIARLLTLEGEPAPEVPMRSDARRGVDLFAPISGGKLNSRFLVLRDSRNSSAARELLREFAHWVVDLDGNLVRDFQTTGFDARIWELYLRAVFTALDFNFDRSSAVPDFRLTREEVKIFVEAVTANPTGSVEFDVKKMPPDPPEDFWHYLEHDMPQKFGSPLLSKLRKRYWEREDVAGHPFMLAIADFHSPGSMTWSRPALPFYLYGMGVEVREDADGHKQPHKKLLPDHLVGQKKVPTNFFSQEEVRNVSAVLFSNAGTMAKFNRMGVLAGFGDPEVSLVRSGGYEDLTPGALKPTPFELNIEDPDYREGWVDEVEIFHNPNAIVPLPKELIPNVKHFFVDDDGEVVWRSAAPPPYVLFSNTVSRAPQKK